MSKKLVGYWKLLRISEWYGKVALVTAMSLSFGHTKYSLTIFILVYLINILNNAFAFGINDLEDAEDDAKDPTKINRNPISAKLINKAEGYLIVYATAVACIALSYSFNLTTAIFSSITITVGFLYSYKPVRLKSMPVFDILSHGFFLGFAQFLIPAIALDIPITASFLLVAIGIYATSAFGDIHNEIRDYEVDRKTNIRNTASFIDLRKYESPIHTLHIFILTLILLTVVLNLTPISRTKTIIAMMATFVTATLLPKKIKKTLYKYSEPLMTIGSLAFLYIIFQY